MYNLLCYTFVKWRQGHGDRRQSLTLLAPGWVTTQVLSDPNPIHTYYKPTMQLYHKKI